MQVDNSEIDQACYEYMDAHPSDEAHYVRYRKAYSTIMTESENAIRAYANTVQTETVAAHQLLRARASSVADILRITSAEPDFAKQAAGSFLDGHASEKMSGGYGTGSPTEKRQQAYDTALREVMATFPNIAKAWLFGTWNEAAVLEAWPHLPAKFSSEKKLTKETVHYRQQVRNT